MKDSIFVETALKDASALLDDARLLAGDGDDGTLAIVESNAAIASILGEILRRIDTIQDHMEAVRTSVENIELLNA